MPLYKCETCGFYTENKKHYSNHLNTNKHKKNVCNVINTVENQNKSNYKCETCNFSTHNKYLYTRHLNTNKHKYNVYSGIKPIVNQNTNSKNVSEY